MRFGTQLWSCSGEDSTGKRARWGGSTRKGERGDEAAPVGTGLNQSVRGREDEPPEGAERGGRSTGRRRGARRVEAQPAASGSRPPCRARTEHVGGPATPPRTPGHRAASDQRASGQSKRGRPSVCRKEGRAESSLGGSGDRGLTGEAGSFPTLSPRPHTASCIHPRAPGRCRSDGPSPSRSRPPGPFPSQASACPAPAPSVHSPSSTRAAQSAAGPERAAAVRTPPRMATAGRSPVASGTVVLSDSQPPKLEKGK